MLVIVRTSTEAHFLRSQVGIGRTMRSRQDVLFNFGPFLPKSGCHGNSLGCLEILDSIFEIADPENPTIHAKFVSISCTEIKLCHAYLNVAYL